MDNHQILEKLQTIFRDTLDNESIILSPASTADDIEEWDSIAHMMLVVEIEKSFGIKFKVAEVSAWQQVADLIQSIAAKLPNAGA